MDLRDIAGSGKSLLRGGAMAAWWKSPRRGGDKHSPLFVWCMVEMTTEESAPRQNDYRKLKLQYSVFTKHFFGLWPNPLILKQSINLHSGAVII